MLLVTNNLVASTEHCMRLYNSVGYHKVTDLGKSRATCLTNRTRPISRAHHITPLVINALRGGHIHSIPTYKPKQFQETRHVRLWPCVPGLIIIIIA